MGQYLFYNQNEYQVLKDFIPWIFGVLILTNLIGLIMVPAYYGLFLKIMLLGVLGIITCLNPNNGIYLVLAAFPLEFTETWFHFHVIKLYRIIMIFVFISWGFRKVIYKDIGFIKIFKNRISLFIIGLIIWNCITLLYSVLWKTGIGEIVRMSFYFFFMIVVIDCIKDIQGIKKLIKYILYCGMIIVCIGLYEKISGKSLYYPIGHWRIASTFFDPNIYGRYLMINAILLFSLLLYFKTSVKYKIILGLVFSVFFSSIIFTDSRSSLVALILGIIILILFSKKRTIIIPVFLIATLTTYYFLPLRYKVRIWSIVDFRVKNVRFHNNRRRIALELSGLNMIKNHFFLGVGVASFPHYFDRYNEIPSGPGDKATESHNFLTRTFAELGIIGFLLTLTIIFLLIKKCFYLYKNSANDKWFSLSLLTVIITIVCQAVFYSPFFYYFYTWIFMAFVVMIDTDKIKDRV